MRKKSNSSSIVFLLFLIILIIGIVLIYNSSMFARNAPMVKIQNDGYWNLKSPLHVTIDDKSGIKAYSILLKLNNKTFILVNNKRPLNSSQVSFNITTPKEAMLFQAKQVIITIIARDKSNWNFFRGNVTKKSYHLIIDTTAPILTDVAHSYAITRGGSAVVIFQAIDPHLKNITIQTNTGRIFKPQPFYKTGYYISLVAWPIKDKNFRATIIATDTAGNISRQYIAYYLTPRKFKSSHIKITDNFLNSRVAILAQQYPQTDKAISNLQKFEMINSTIRSTNEKLISTVTSKVSNNIITNFHIKPMYPLVNAALMAVYGDHRTYVYKGKIVSKSVHMGIDLASIKMAKIRTTNAGIVAFANFNGVYGNMILIDNGLGLYTLYAHCSRFLVYKGERVHANEIIARSGSTGDAMGDHLHFDTIVQGVEIRPQEWMDAHWIKVNIIDIINIAKKIINRQ